MSNEELRDSISMIIAKAMGQDGIHDDAEKCTDQILPLIEHIKAERNSLRDALEQIDKSKGYIYHTCDGHLKQVLEIARAALKEVAK